MIFSGFLGISSDFLKNFEGCSLDFYGFPGIPEDSSGFLRISKDFLGFLRGIQHGRYCEQFKDKTLLNSLKEWIN